MAVTDNESAFVDTSAVPISLSQMFTVTPGSSDPTYLVLTLLDRDEYTAAATGATGSLSGNGSTLALGSVGGDGRGTGIVFTYTYNAATGQYGYFNSTYGWFNQVTYTSSASAGDVTDLSLFGTSNAGLANLFGTNPDLMMEDDAAGYLGGATVVTQPGYTATVPAQATPDSIAAAADSFVGQAWNLNGCWVLASTIAADAGTSLPTQSTLVGLSGQANGEWIVAFNGPAGQTGNWQNMVTAGEMIVFEPAAGGGHVTTCVSGSGSTAMLVDNVEYVNGSGQIQNPANDGSSADIIIAAQHPASQEFAGVSTSTVVIYELDTPIVTSTVTSDSLAGLASLSLGSLFSATDPGSKTITSWQVYDTATSDSLMLGGTDYSDHSATTALTASTLASISLLAGSIATTDTLEVRAYNGSYWGDWDSLSVTITATAPLVLAAPVLVTQTANQSWNAGTAITLALPAGTFTDPQSETLTYTATQQNGQALPSWLTFNPTTDTFTGTAPGTAQALALKVTATDTSGLSVSDDFSATVIGAPVLQTQTANQSWNAGAAITLALPAGTFTDPQSEALTYTATQQNGQALPSWLTFNPTTDTFTATAPATAQTLALKVTATDTSGLSVSDDFSATVIGAPVLQTQTANQSWNAGTAITLALPAGTFTDPQSEALTYTATQQNGQALPGWLTFNPATDSFSGTAPASAQTLALKVTVTDTSGLSVSDNFSATVIGAPVLVTQTANQSWNAGTAITLALPAGTFTDPQSEALTYTATQQNGQALPGWLTFNPATDSFSGTAPASAQTLALKVTATDTSGLSVSDDFSATVIGAPVLQTQTANQSWNAGAAITLALPAGTFTDPQSEALTYTATQQNGQALPSWLTFNPTTDTFTATAPATAQTLALKVTATDTSGLSVSDDFSATVIGAPVLQTQTANQSWNAGTAITLALPAGTFTDPQSEALTYTATQQNGQALPGWLTFNPATDSFSGTAPASAQTLALKVTVTDTSGLSVSDNFSATVIGAPVLVTQTANQSWNAGTAITLALPAGTFTDPQSEALTYTATQQNGQALPGWLTFNPATDSFSGTAPASAQTLALKVTVTDTSGLSVSDDFSATVIGAPVLQTQTANQSWNAGAAITLALPAGTFTDPQSEALTYTATQQNGQALPSWLTFNPTTDTFTATAPATAQTLALKVTATDTSGLSVSDDFSATVIGAPVLQTQTANQSWNAGTAITLALPAGTFTDPQSEALTYTATQQNGQALPGWLTFNPATDSFSGTAPASAQTLALKVTVTDTSGLSVSDDFSATVIGAPVLQTQTANQSWNAGTAITLALPAGTFTDPQSEALTYTATQQNGQALPSWLTFNPATDSFSGTAPAAAQTLGIEVTATDASGLSVSDTFSATVIGAPDLVTQTANQNWTGGTAISLALPVGTFADPQGEALTYTATLQDGQGLPAWLTFNPTTDSFSGTAPASAQTLALEVTATDTSSLSVSDSFSATVIAAPIYLTRTPTVFAGTGVNDVFIAAANVLYSGDQITGGSGLNTLVLQGGGAFSLAAPSVLTNIQVVDATEGQAGAEPSIFLRNGTSLTLNLAPASTNPQASAAVVHGANNNDVINLGAGSDSVYLGGPGETVVGGSGADAYFATAATIGATIVGGSGTNTLYVQGGGTVTMGSNITGVPTVVLQNAGISYNFIANATAGLVIHASTDSDTITPGDASQTVMGSTGPLHVLATATTAGVEVLGNSTASNVLEITNGGTIGLNNADRYVSVQLDAAATLMLPTSSTISITGSAGNDVFMATTGVLRAGQQITGGSGLNTLVLQGGGVFNLAAPSVLTNIQVVDATEGQAAAEPSIFLRNGTSLTLNLAPASTNPQTSAAVVHGANNNDVINLGAGTDTVYLGGAGETVVGGSGTDLYYATAATIGATIVGGSGTNTLYVQGGGTVTMGSNITGVPTVVLQNAGTSYNFVANATAGLAIHASTDSDTITVGSASQKVFGSSGNLLVLATAANAGAAVEGSSTGSSNVLDITTSGTIALNSADDYLTVQLGAANTTLSLDHMKFIQAEGSGGNDVIIAGAAGQILTGGGGNDTLEDAGHYGVTFQDTAAGFSGDTIMDFTKVDKIDITGFSPPSGPPIYTGTYGASGSGVLAVTNGTGTVDIHMSALTAGGTFQAVSDLNGGTLITYS